MHRDVFAQWSPGPSNPRAAESQVDVWRIDLAPPARRYPDPIAHRAVARAAMRDLLGRYLERPAEMLALSLQPGGKPFLDLPIKFNLSHCADTALLAVTPTAEVGVDVERLREVGDPLRLAGRALTADELAQLSDAPADRQLELFFDLWTRMEARQKAFGRGIFAGRVDPGEVSSFGFRPSPLHFASLAVCLPHTSLSLRFFDYAGP
ncbi:MAG TPA: 4'-phosphopantetheinyl transferase superfamily protein [Gammaproteobacteria bacterium]|nr:4'-phosphopantetheinyl transferase superfamily protein [Gammaproteobacteria bacterium]